MTKPKHIKAQSPAKLNLTFDIVGTLPDGFHAVSTLLQSIDLEDTLSFDIRPASQTSIKLSLSDGQQLDSFPLDDTNLIARAVRSFLRKLDSKESLSISVTIEKNIPVAAGLAGGSSNCAATLLALNSYFGQPLSNKDLLEVGAALGSDVPFCLTGGTCIGTNRGELLEGVNHHSRLYFAVVKPRELSIATPWLYAEYDKLMINETMPRQRRSNLHAAVSSLKNGELDDLSMNFGNVFEPIVFAEHPQLGLIKDRLIQLGVWSCHLTGSGPTLFALVPDREMAHFVRRKLKEDQAKYDGRDWSHTGYTLDFWIAESSTTGARVISSEDQ